MVLSGPACCTGSRTANIPVAIPCDRQARNNREYPYVFELGNELLLTPIRNVLRPIFGHVEARPGLARDDGKAAANVLPDWGNYYVAAERSIEDEWNEIIWPHIKDFDFDTVLELAPGWGRSTERLCEIEDTYAVDFNRRPSMGAGRGWAIHTRVAISCMPSITGRT